MRLAWHIAWKDLRRLRWAIFGFGLLIAIRLILGALLVSGLNGDLVVFMEMAVANEIILGLQVVTIYFIVAGFIHEDVLVGTTAFWTTRPISGTRLLWGKLIGLIVTGGIIPILIMLPWWLGCGYGLGQIASAAIETFAWQALVVAIALPLATLTDGLSRYLVWTLMLIATLATGALSLKASPTPTGADFARTLFAAATFLVSGVIATVLYFCIRQFRLSVGTLGLGAALATWVFSCLPTREEQVFRSAPMAGTNLQGITLALLKTSYGERKNGEVFIDSEYRIDHVPPDLQVLARGAEQRWDLGGSVISGRENFLATTGGEYAARALGLAPAQIKENFPRNFFPRYFGTFQAFGPNQAISSAAVLPSIAQRIQNENPASTIQAHLRLFRPRIIGERPALAGERIGSGAEVTRIVTAKVVGPYSRPANRSVPSAGRGEKYLWGMLMIAEHAPMVWQRTWPEWPRRDYFLVNRRLPTAAVVFRDGPAELIRIGTVGISWRYLQSNSDQPNWFENATLAVLAYTPEEIVTTELHVDRFRFPADYREGAAP